jgi:hypothetical protein
MRSPSRAQRNQAQSPRSRHHGPHSPAGGTTAHRVLTSYNKPVPTTPYSPAGGTTAHSILTSSSRYRGAGRIRRAGGTRRRVASAGGQPVVRQRAAAVPRHQRPAHGASSHQTKVASGWCQSIVACTRRWLGLRPCGRVGRRGPLAHPPILLPGGQAGGWGEPHNGRPTHVAGAVHAGRRAHGEWISVTHVHHCAGSGLEQPAWVSG